MFEGVAKDSHLSKPVRPSFFAAYAKVARFEYLPAEVLLVMIPILLVLQGPEGLLSLRFIETVVVFFLLYFTGFMANALADRKLDATYSSYKAKVAISVDVIGESRLMALLAAHVAVALILTFHLFLMTGNYLILLFVGLGLFLGVGYSMGPFHFKTRGVAHGLALASSAFFLPLAFIVVTLSGQLDLLLLLFIAGFTMAMYSLEFGNQAMDYFEDLRSNIRTPSVRYSVRKTVVFSLALLVLGLLMTTVTLASLLVVKVGIIHPFFAELAVILVPTILVIGFLGPAIGLGRIFQGASPARGGTSIDPKRMRLALKTVDHPRWQASGALGVVMVCALMFVGIFFPLSQNGPTQPVNSTVPDVNILNNNNMVANVGELVNFTAEVKSGGNIRTMYWNFGDKSGDSGINTSHRYNKIGTYTVNFTVICNDNRQVSHWINITVTKLYFSKLVLTAKKVLTNTRIDYDFNVTNDKDLKQQGELMVEMYYQDFQVLNLSLEKKLYPANVWPGQGYLDLITLDKNLAIKVVLVQWVGANQVEVEEHMVHPG
jgi:1,4-dihydroxy-2-naphthoate octaprenyltransferase